MMMNHTQLRDISKKFQKLFEKEYDETRAAGVSTSGAFKSAAEKINKQLLRINDFLIGLFRGVGIKLVDFKVEFGKVRNSSRNEIILADEISPDTCRLWDAKSEKKFSSF